jgi:hypothetical protein
VQISDASGFLNTRINSGESYNKGFEAALNLTPVSTKNFRWDFSANTSYNITKVEKIATSTPGERATIGTHPFNGEVRIVVGEEMGQIAGYGYARDSSTGQMIFQSNGCHCVLLILFCLVAACLNGPAVFSTALISKEFISPY